MEGCHEPRYNTDPKADRRPLLVIASSSSLLSRCHFSFPYCPVPLGQAKGRSCQYDT